MSSDLDFYDKCCQFRELWRNRSRQLSEKEIEIIKKEYGIDDE